MRDIVYLNGKFVPHDEALVSVEDRGFQFADGVYEVTKFYGRQGLRLDEHLARLERSSVAMRFGGIHSPAQWRDIIARLMEECELPTDPDATHTLYQQVTRGACPRAHLFPKDPLTPTSIAYFRRAPAYDPELRRSGVALSQQTDERWDKCFIKTVCLLPAIWAKQEAVNAGAFEAMLVRDGLVTEGASTNIFCVINGAVHTHPEGPHILSGITRQIVLQATAQLGLAVVMRPVPVSEFLAAEEAFICSTTLEVMPVTRVDTTVFSGGEAGPVTQRIMAAVRQIVTDELAAGSVAER